MKIPKRFVREFRRSINPPYGINDLPVLLGLTTTLALIMLTAILMGQPRDTKSFASASEQEIGKEEFLSNEVLVKLKKPASDKIKPDTKPSRVGVKSIERINEDLEVEDFERVIPEKKNEPKKDEALDWYKVEIPGEELKIKGDFDEEADKIKSNHPASAKLQEAIDYFNADPNVESVEPNFVVKILRTPNDPYYSSSGSWGQSYADLWGMPKIDADSAWDQTTGSTSIIVADIDTGVDRNHPDIANNMWVNTAETPNNGVDDDQNGYVDDYYGWDWVNNDGDPMDDHGHGTHVAGTIAAVGNNATGVVGVNWTSKIMALKFLSSGGSGSLSNGIAALRYAADMGAKVSSNSWGCACNSAAMDDAVKYEHEKGMVMVAAAGNSNADTIGFSPASADRAIAVAATDYLDRKAYFSNWGEKVDVAAPGVDILSLKAAVSPMCSASRTVDTRYCRVSGTSMAAPHVSGLAALLWASNPSLTNEEIRQIIRHGADDLGSAGKDRNFGYGRINANGSTALTGGRYMRPIITEPRSRTTISGSSYNVLGGVAGPRFASYKLEAGLGRSPTSWQLLKNSTTQVISGTLATIDTTALSDGDYIFRVTATATDGKKYQFQVHDVKVDNVRDTQPPTVTITSPSNGSTVSRYVYIIASATDNDKVAKVYFYVDGVLKAVDYSPTYYYYWNSASVSNGSHNLVAKAYDEAGNIGTSPTVTVNVSNAPPDSTPPTVNITSPANGSIVSGNVNITASATDNVGVKYVYFYIDGVWKRTDSTTPYTYYWDTTGVGDGSHSMFVIAVDTSNNIGRSPALSVKVDNTPPNVSITSPKFGSTVSGNTTIAVGATDSTSGVSKVEFMVDGIVKGQDTTSPYTYLWDTTVYSDGSHTLTANAWDVAGNYDVSPVVAVTVSNSQGDTQPPSKPAGLVGKAVSSTQINLVWNLSSDNVGVIGYNIIRDGTKVATSIGTNFGDGTVSSSTTYTYKVTAFDAAGNTSVESDTVQVTTPYQDTKAPSVPTGLKARLVSSSRIDLAWSASKDDVGVVGYRIYRNKWLIKTTSRTSLSDTRVSAGRTYYYRVAAFDAAGNQSARSAAVKVSIASGAPKRKQGDLNNDSRINIRDLSIILSRWATVNATADLDNSGRVNIRDLSILLSRWGK